MNKNIGFVTDSTSDIPVDVAAKYEIDIVPAMIIFGGKVCATAWIFPARNSTGGWQPNVCCQPLRHPRSGILRKALKPC